MNFIEVGRHPGGHVEAGRRGERQPGKEARSVEEEVGRVPRPLRFEGSVSFFLEGGVMTKNR